MYFLDYLIHIIIILSRKPFPRYVAKPDYTLPSYTVFSPSLQSGQKPTGSCQAAASSDLSLHPSEPLSSREFQGTICAARKSLTLPSRSAHSSVLPGSCSSGSRHRLPRGRAETSVTGAPIRVIFSPLVVCHCPFSCASSDEAESHGLP